MAPVVVREAAVECVLRLELRRLDTLSPAEVFFFTLASWSICVLSASVDTMEAAPTLPFPLMLQARHKHDPMPA